jgi:ribosomal protein S18 acetylase RimI-like enzyme
MEIKLRDIALGDIELQKELIYIALWDHPDEPRRAISVLEAPEIKAYYENWGQWGDVGIVAMIHGKPAGFIQSRFKDSDTEKYANYPELSIAVFSQFREYGVATTMFIELISRVKDFSSGLRLGVHPRNEAAINLYHKFGFEFYEHPEGCFPQMALKFD